MGKQNLPIAYSKNTNKTQEQQKPRIKAMKANPSPTDSHTILVWESVMESGPQNILCVKDGGNYKLDINCTCSSI